MDMEGLRRASTTGGHAARGQAQPEDKEPSTANKPSITWFNDPEEYAKPPEPVEGLVYFPSGRPTPEDPGGHVWLPRGILAMLAGEGGVGKTTALVQLALAVASGDRWLGSWGENERLGQTSYRRDKDEHAGLPCRQGGVLYFSAEDSLNNLRHRFRAARVARALNAGVSMDAPPENIAPLGVVTRDSLPDGLDLNIFPDRTTKERTALLSPFAKMLVDAAPSPCALVILDPLVQLMATDAEENDNLDATEAMEGAKMVLRAIGKRQGWEPTVLISHHQAKSGGGSNAARGASAFKDNVRWLASMEHIYYTRNPDLESPKDDKSKTTGRTPLLNKTPARSGVLRLDIVKSNETLCDSLKLVLDAEVRAVRLARGAELRRIGLQPPRNANEEGFDHSLE